MGTLYILFVGFLMGLLETSPSGGGTIAYILGIYDDFIKAVSELVSKDFQKTKKAFFFLFKLAIGWGIGYIISISIIAILLENYTYQISSLFLGLILISVPLTFLDEIGKKIEFKRIIWSVFGILSVILLFYISQLFSINNIANNEIVLSTYIYLFIVGFITATAYILPGIGGSTILLIFGVYYFIIDAIKEIINFNFSLIFPILIFFIGIILGIILLSKLLKILFNKYRLNINYFIEGLLIGSIIPIIYSPTELISSNPPLNFQNISYVFLLIGIIFLLFLEYIKTLAKKKY